MRCWSDSPDDFRFPDNEGSVCHGSVPAHRVVNRNGMLTGKHHFNPPGIMEELLKKEGIKVKNDQVVDFKKHFWDPVEELGI